MNTIKINGKEYVIKNTIRAMFLFESITEKQFEIKTMLDNYTYFYCLILANNPDCNLDWNDFIDALDSDTSIFKQLNEIISQNNKIEKLLNDNGIEDKEGVKKK